LKPCLGNKTKFNATFFVSDCTECCDVKYYQSCTLRKPTTSRSALGQAQPHIKRYLELLPRV